MKRTKSLGLSYSPRKANSPGWRYMHRKHMVSLLPGTALAWSDLQSASLCPCMTHELGRQVGCSEGERICLYGLELHWPQGELASLDCFIYYYTSSHQYPLEKAGYSHKLTTMTFSFCVPPSLLGFATWLSRKLEFYATVVISSSTWCHIMYHTGPKEPFTDEEAGQVLHLQAMAQTQIYDSTLWKSSSIWVSYNKCSWYTLSPSPVFGKTSEKLHPDFVPEITNRCSQAWRRSNSIACSLQHEQELICFPDKEKHSSNAHQFRNYRTGAQNSWGWKRRPEVMWSIPLLKVGSDRAGHSGPCPAGFWMSPRMETLHRLWAACVNIWSLSQWKRFF